jgi:hypothetical protein
MQLTKQKIILVSGIVVMGLVIIVLSVKLNSYLNKTKSTEQIQENKLYDLRAEEIPNGLSWNELEGMVVTGVFQEMKVGPQGYILVTIPDIGKIKALLQDSGPILTLRLQSGKETGVQKWEGIPQIDLNEYLKPGQQITIHLGVSGEESDKIKAELNMANPVEVSPVNRIVMGEY